MGLAALALSGLRGPLRRCRNICSPTKSIPLWPSGPPGGARPRPRSPDTSNAAPTSTCTTATSRASRARRSPCCGRQLPDGSAILIVPGGGYSFEAIDLEGFAPAALRRARDHGLRAHLPAARRRLEEPRRRTAAGCAARDADHSSRCAATTASIPRASACWDFRPAAIWPGRSRRNSDTKSMRRSTRPTTTIRGRLHGAALSRHHHAAAFRTRSVARETSRHESDGRTANGLFRRARGDAGDAADISVRGGRRSRRTGRQHLHDVRELARRESSGRNARVRKGRSRFRLGRTGAPASQWPELFLRWGASRGLFPQRRRERQAARRTSRDRNESAVAQSLRVRAMLRRMFAQMAAKLPRAGAAVEQPQHMPRHRIQRHAVAAIAPPHKRYRPRRHRRARAARRRRSAHRHRQAAPATDRRRGPSSRRRHGEDAPRLVERGDAAIEHDGERRVSRASADRRVRNRAAALRGFPSATDLRATPCAHARRRSSRRPPHTHRRARAARVPGS